MNNERVAALAAVAEAVGAGAIQSTTSHETWVLCRCEHAILYVPTTADGQETVADVLSRVARVSQRLTAIGFQAPEVNDLAPVHGWDYHVGSATLVPGIPLTELDPDSWTQFARVPLLPAATFATGEDGDGLRLNLELEDVKVNDDGVSGVQVTEPVEGPWENDLALIDVCLSPEHRENGYAFLDVLGIPVTEEQRQAAREVAKREAAQLDESIRERVIRGL